MEAKLLRTIETLSGNIFRKNSVVLIEKMYGGYRITKKRKNKNGYVVSASRIKKKDFQLID